MFFHIGIVETNQVSVCMRSVCAYCVRVCVCVCVGVLCEGMCV